jgi:hypothetical protein
MGRGTTTARIALRTALAASVSLALCSAGPTPTPEGPLANEAQAIASLREIWAAQVAFRAAVEIDTDCDGLGEYGYFAELAGTRPMRIADTTPKTGCVPAAGSWPSDLLRPRLLRTQFGQLRNSCTLYGGYLFQMWLPDPTVGGVVYARMEDLSGGKAGPPYPDSDNGEKLWCCYAWPLEYGVTGRSAFFINQRGRVLRCANRSYANYAGLINGPAFDAAYTIDGDMSSPLGVAPAASVSGYDWWPVD